MNRGRKLKNNRKKNKYAGKSKSKPSNKRRESKNSHYKALVIKVLGIEAKQPNSGKRKCVRARLITTGETITAYIPFDGGLKWAFIKEFDEIMVQRYRKPIGDIPGVKYKVIKSSHKSMKYWYKWDGHGRVRNEHRPRI